MALVDRVACQIDDHTVSVRLYDIEGHYGAARIPNGSRDSADAVDMI